MFRTAGSRLIHSLALTAAAVALSFSFAGCSSSGSSSSDDAGSKMCVQADVDKIFATNCISCHTGTGYAGLDLTPASLPGLVGKPPAGGGMTVASVCANMGKVYLTAHSNPSTGLLLDKLTSNPGCGVQMPFGGNPLSASDISCIKSWALTLTSP